MIIHPDKSFLVMDSEIKSQIDRAKELFDELRVSCEHDLQSQMVSDKTKNLTQEVLVKMRSVFDQSMYKFFETEIAPTLKKTEIYKARVYFPIVSDKSSLESVLGRGKMTRLNQTHPAVYAFIESVQPYNKSYEWLSQFSKFANEKHIRLTPQKRFEQERITVTNQSGGSVSWSTKNVKFGSGVRIMGAPVDPSTQNIVPTPEVMSRRDVWISFMLEDSGINSLALCKRAIEEGEQIISHFFGLF